MRALRYDPAARAPRLGTSAPIPEPVPGEALVRVLRIGISGSDIAAARGQSAFDGVLGHEFVGIVERANVPADAPSALRLKAELVGRKVTAAPGIACGQCEMCRSGLSPHCRARAVLGVWARDGAMADFVAIPLVNLHEVPAGIADDTAALAYPLACGLHAALVAGLARAPGRSFVTVLGDGAVGMLAAAAIAKAKEAGAHAGARVLSTNPVTLDLCDRWGIKHRPTGDAGRRQDQDVVIDATGTAAGLRLALQFVRPRGTVVLAAPAPRPPAPPGVPLAERPGEEWAAGVDLSLVALNEVQLLGSRDGPMPDALKILQRGDVDAAALIGRRFRLDDGVAALAAAAETAGGPMRTLIEV